MGILVFKDLYKTFAVVLRSLKILQRFSPGPLANFSDLLQAMLMFFMNFKFQLRQISENKIWKWDCRFPVDADCRYLLWVGHANNLPVTYMGCELHEVETLYSWLHHSEEDWQPCKLNMTFTKTIFKLNNFKEVLPGEFNYNNQPCFIQYLGDVCIWWHLRLKMRWRSTTGAGLYLWIALPPRPEGSFATDNNSFLQRSERKDNKGSMEYHKREMTELKQASQRAKFDLTIAFKYNTPTYYGLIGLNR